MDDHEIEVFGQWHNDGTAGLVVWCVTCNRGLAETDDALSPARIISIAKEH